MTDSIEPLRVGVTGSQGGLTIEQQAKAGVKLAWFWSLGATELHHGDCVGVDQQVAEMAMVIGYRLICHPPYNSAKRAFVPSAFEWPRAGYLERDKEIVDNVDVLLGFPGTEVEIVRSGTWFTVRYARSIGRSRYIYGPSGIEIEAVVDA